MINRNRLGVSVGDKVWQIENCRDFPNGTWKWEAIVVKAESNYIETEYCRDRNLLWLQELVKKLSPHHRTYERTWEKNYFSPDGSINIEIK